MGLRSRKNIPLGPSLGKVASQAAVSAPCSTERLALLAPPLAPGSVWVDGAAVSATGLLLILLMDPIHHAAEALVGLLGLV